MLNSGGMKVLIKATFPEALESNINIDSEKKIEVIIDNLIPENLTPVPGDTIRFFVTTQPEGSYNEMILNHQDYFTYLLTQFPDLLELPNAGKMVGCGSFVEPHANMPKKFGVSMIISARNCLPGHPIRIALYERRKEIKIPLDIYASSWYTVRWDDTIPMAPWPDRKDKIHAMDCMFHICIDSFKRKDHYSEKLIDPLITKTIPIYWGCTNLSDYFNPKGIIEGDDADDIIRKVNSLTSELYYSLSSEIQDNYERALKVYRYEDILRNAMMKILQKA
jgi:hypothetical protein